MCPMCVATAVLMAASAASAGGLTAFAVKKFHVGKSFIAPVSDKQLHPPPTTTAGEEWGGRI